jgi:hypothetical protein
VLPPQAPRRLTPAKPAGSAPHYRASFEQPEQGRRFDQWLFDLGRVMAGLERYAPPMSKTRRKAEEVPA